MPRDFAKLEEFIQDRMGQTKLAGLSLAVVEGDQITYKRGFGLRNLEKGLAATPSTLYCIGSVTKSITCLAIMQLQEQGLLSVEDPVDRFLPLKVRPFGEPIRIKHLMSHTSGIPALAYLENVLSHHYGSVDKYLPIGSVDDMLTFINGAEDWVFTRPGERWFYFNEGYILLGGIVEKITGKPFAAYVQERILTPLEMNRSSWDQGRFTADGDAAVAYVTNLEGKHLANHYPWGQAIADGGLISSVEDMGRYIAMYLNGGRGVARPESVLAMMTPQVATPPRDMVTGDPVSGYGFGLSEQDFFGRRLIGHSGAMYGATAGMQFLPDQKLGVVALANGTGYAMTTFTSFALAVLLGEDPWQMPALRTEKVLTELAGSYETYKGTYSCRIKRSGDFLMIEFKNKLSESSSPLVPVDLNPEHPRFFTLGGGRRSEVEFVCKDGQVDLIYERYRFRRTGK